MNESNSYDQRMRYKTLISATELESIINDSDMSDVVVLDARFDIDSEPQAALNFLEGHIPGARQADVSMHMAGEIIPGVTGRRPLPEKSAFTASGVGVGLLLPGSDDDCSNSYPGGPGC